MNNEHFLQFKTILKYHCGLPLECWGPTLYFQYLETFHLLDLLITQGVVEDAAPPFHSWVPADPSHQDIYQAVVLKGVRPEVPERWQQCEVLQQMTRLQAEMWHHNPAVRPTALR